MSLKFLLSLSAMLCFSYKIQSKLLIIQATISIGTKTFYLSQMLRSVCEFFPLLHELLLRHSRAQAQLVGQLLNHSLLTKHQRNVVDRRAVGNVDHLEIKTE